MKKYIIFIFLILSTIDCMAWRANSKMEGLLFHYSFDEGAGSYVYDNLNYTVSHGTITGAAWVTSKNGQGDCLTYNYGATFTVLDTKHITFPTTNATLACWVNLHTVESSFDTLLNYVCLPYNAPEWDAPYLSMYLGYHKGAGSVQIGYAVSAANWGVILLSAAPLPLGFHFVVSTFDNGIINGYLDGVFKGSSNVSETGTTIFYGNNKDFTIGRDGWHVPYEKFDGDVDEVSLWDITLTTGQIRNLYYDQKKKHGL